jgi:hypothetical protein
MKLIVERRSFADPNAYYIRPRIMMFARQWNEHNVMGQAA